MTSVREPGPPPLPPPRDRDLRDQPLPVKKNKSALPDSPASQTQKTYTRKVCVQLQELCFLPTKCKIFIHKQEKCAPAALWVRFAAPSKKGLPVPCPAPALPSRVDPGGQVIDASTQPPPHVTDVTPHNRKTLTGSSCGSSSTCCNADTQNDVVNFACQAGLRP